MKIFYFNNSQFNKKVLHQKRLMDLMIENEKLHCKKKNLNA